MIEEVDVRDMRDSRKVMDVADVVELERRIEAGGTSLLVLMQRAGASVVEVARMMLGGNGREEGACKIVVLAGNGNNGGDGWVAAEGLARLGHDVVLISKVIAEEISAEPARTAAVDASLGCDFRVVVLPDDEELCGLLSDADMIVDAILGTGFSQSDVREPFASWIEHANSARSENGALVLAVDCPSGLSAQTGTAASDCISADATVTMLAVKPGLVSEAVTEHVGKLYLSTLDAEGLGACADGRASSESGK